MLFISVNCGTTNMRCRLYSDDGLKVIAESKRKSGVRNTAFEGKSDCLRKSLRDCIDDLLSESGKNESDIERVISVGTLSSNVGIYHVHHIVAPAGLKEVAFAAKTVALEDITRIPILFVPGVKIMPDRKTEETRDRMRIIEKLDSMSGEECEAFGIMERLGISGNVTFCLPGSYNKTFNVDGEGRIIDMYTGMCGEFMTSIAENTLLGHTLPHPVVRKIIPEKLIEGYLYSKEKGTSPALIKSRMLAVNYGYSEDETGNYFAGAALADDISITAGATVQGRPLIIGGPSPLREIFRILLGYAGTATERIIDAGEELSSLSSLIGGHAVWRLNSGK